MTWISGPLSILAAIMAIGVARSRSRILQGAAPYLYFAITPTLSLAGLVGVLTGMNAELPRAPWLFGVSFYSLFIAHCLSVHQDFIRRNPFGFLAVAGNPLYFATGPVPSPSWKRASVRALVRRLRIVHGDLLYGVLFSCVLAPSLTGFFYLHSSLNTLDVVAFGGIYELYVYLNFCGFSTLAWVALRVLGVRARRNFQQPFGASSMVEFWQRWHVTLGMTLKDLFFRPLRHKFGLHTAVFAVFLASALWHGVTTNFLLWGLFHASAWLLSYKFRQWRRTNTLLMVFAVIVGRIIFSESNTPVLLEKLSALMLPGNWSRWSVTLSWPASFVDRLNVMACAVVLAIEIIASRTRFAPRNYSHLRGRWASAIVASYICLFLRLAATGPVYGDR